MQSSGRYPSLKGLSRPRPGVPHGALKRAPSTSHFSKLRVSPTGTLLYSSIFAAAAIADSQFKTRRQNELTLTIEHQRRELERLEKSVEEKTQRLLNTMQETIHLNTGVRQQTVEGDGAPSDLRKLEQIAEDAAKRACDLIEKDEAPELWARTESSFEKVAIQQNIILETQRAKQSDDYLHTLLKYAPYKGKPRAPTTPSLEAQRTWQSLPPQSPWADDCLRGRIQPWTVEKRTKAATCVTRLVIQICLACELHTLGPDELSLLPPKIQPFARLTKSKLKEAWRLLELRLNAMQYPKYNKLEHPQLGIDIPFYPTEADGGIIGLNDSLEKLLPPGRRITISTTALATICAILLKSRTHPDVQTCNILMNAFYRAGRQDLVDIVIDFVRDASIRPNELTCLETLRSYRKRGLSSQYLEYLSMMRGFRSGLMLASPKIEDTTASGGFVVEKHPGSNVKVQAIKPNSILYAEIVQGLLKFVGLQQTIEICSNLYQYGWGWSYPAMHRLILQCAIDLDWDLCLYIWEFVQALYKNGNPMPKQVYARMLAFCTLSKRLDLFSTIFPKSLVGPEIKVAEMLKLIDLEMELINEERNQTSP
jgi:hypothetical protein